MSSATSEYDISAEDADKLLIGLTFDGFKSQNIIMLHIVVNVKLIDENKKDVVILDPAFRVLGFLSFRMEGVCKIVQYDGINAIISAIDEHVGTT